MPTDPVMLTRELIRCVSVTPTEGGAISLLADRLTAAGFDCQRADRSGIANLFARWGPPGHPRTFGFNGHTDVVPPGDPERWTHDPFGGELIDGWVWGRGATDMKSGVAAFVAAAIDLVSENPPDGAVIVTVTGDEEGDGAHGTLAILDFMAEKHERMAVCLVGEPTCPDTFGEMMKIGRRGSMTAIFTAIGVQGHAAYPQRAKNPVSAMARLIDRIASTRLDEGTDHFGPTTLVPVNFDTGNRVTNVIPGSCRAAVNIRFNDAHSSASLGGWLRAQADAVQNETGVEIEMRLQVSGESFLTPPGPLSDLVSRAVAAETGVTPALSTTGGTSDARFVKDHCPVVEFGLVGRTMHQVDERVEAVHIETLKRVYGRILREYFA